MHRSVGLLGKKTFARSSCSRENVKIDVKLLEMIKGQLSAWGLREEYIIRNLTLHCNKLFLQLEPVTVKSHGVVPRLLFLLEMIK